MWKITRTITAHYPYMVLELTDVASGERGLWAMADGQSEDILRESRMKGLAGILLSGLPGHGGWISEEEINGL